MQSDAAANIFNGYRTQGVQLMDPSLGVAEIVPVSDDLTLHGLTLLAAESLHRSLRPDLPRLYDGYMRRMFAEGAEMAVLVVDGVVKSLAVYRSHHTTFHGFRFYIDDLVTHEADRGSGYGHRIMSWCEARARERGCDTIDLESGVQRPRTHQFYFRERLTIFAFGFTKPLA
jgi:GNAT superfamily N-acetyltransferase